MQLKESISQIGPIAQTIWLNRCDFISPKNIWLISVWMCSLWFFSFHMFPWLQPCNPLTFCSPKKLAPAKWLVDHDQEIDGRWSLTRCHQACLLDMLDLTRKRAWKDWKLTTWTINKRKKFNEKLRFTMKNMDSDGNWPWRIVTQTWSKYQE